MAVERGHSLPIRMVASAPMLVSVINAVLLAVIAALLTFHVGGAGVAVFGVAVFGFIIGLVVQVWYALRAIAKGVKDYEPIFPAAGPATLS